jgi:hypothetical protein
MHPGRIGTECAPIRSTRSQTSSIGPGRATLARWAGRSIFSGISCPLGRPGGSSRSEPVPGGSPSPSPNVDIGSWASTWHGRCCATSPSTLEGLVPPGSNPSRPMRPSSPYDRARSSGPTGSTCSIWWRDGARPWTSYFGSSFARARSWPWTPATGVRSPRCSNGTGRSRGRGVPSANASVPRTVRSSFGIWSTGGARSDGNRGDGDGSPRSPSKRRSRTSITARSPRSGSPPSRSTERSCGTCESGRVPTSEDPVRSSGSPMRSAWRSFVGLRETAPEPLDLRDVHRWAPSASDPRPNGSNPVRTGRAGPISSLDRRSHRGRIDRWFLSHRAFWAVAESRIRPIMTPTPRKRPSPAAKKRNHKVRQMRIAARRRQVTLGGLRR